jgi:hypothetical protein
MGCKVSKVRPAELLRSGFDSVLEFIKCDKYDVVWIDLAKPSTFAGDPKLSQIMQRMRAMVTACQRHDVPCVISSHHSSVWHPASVPSFTHRWCAFGIKTQLGNPRAVTHRCASTFAWQSTPCRCPGEAEHVHDLAWRDPCCTGHQRHTVEVEATEDLSDPHGVATPCLGSQPTQQKPQLWSPMLQCQHQHLWTPPTNPRTTMRVPSHIVREEPHPVRVP